MKTSKFYTSYFPLVGILLLSLLVFSPTLFNDFQMGWDDQWMVMNPLTVRYFNFATILEILKTPFNGQWAPINQFLYTSVFNIFGYNATVYHALSLVFHLMNICLVFSLVQTLTHDCLQMLRSEITFVTIVTTLLFAIHPLQVETIAWISASKVLVSTFFYLIATKTFIFYLKRKHKFYYVCTLILYTCAYFSKENVLMFPLWATFINFLYNKSYKNFQFWIILIPFYLITIVFSVHMVFYVSQYDDIIKNEGYSIGKRLVFCFYSLCSYFYKWLYPINLNWEYAFPIGIHDEIPLWLILYPVLVIISCAFLWEYVKRPIVLGGIVTFLIHLLFVIHLLVLPRASIIADRYMYLPLVGLSFVSSAAISRFHRHLKVLYTIIMILVLFYAFQSFERTQDWKNTDTLKNECMHTI